MEPSNLYFIYLFILGFFLFIFFSFIFISWRLITLQHCSGFCHKLKWISHGFTCIPHPGPPAHLPLHQIPLGLPSAPGPSTAICVLNKASKWLSYELNKTIFVWLSGSNNQLTRNTKKDVNLHKDANGTQTVETL